MFSDGGPRGRVDEDEGKPPGRLCGAKPSDIMKLESPGVAIVALKSSRRIGQGQLRRECECEEMRN